MKPALRFLFLPASCWRFFQGRQTKYSAYHDLGRISEKRKAKFDCIHLYAKKKLFVACLECSRQFTSYHEFSKKGLFGPFPQTQTTSLTVSSNPKVLCSMPAQNRVTIYMRIDPHKDFQ